MHSIISVEILELMMNANTLTHENLVLYVNSVKFTPINGPFECSIQALIPSGARKAC